MSSFVIPVFILVFIFYKKEKLENSLFRYKFTAFMEGLKIKNRIEKLYYFMHYLRRLFIVIITVALLHTKIDEIQTIAN